MILDLREIDNFPAHLFLESDSDKIMPDYNGLRGISKVTAELDIQKSGEEYYCQGRIEATVRLECSRCLKEFDTHVGNKTDFIICYESLNADHSGKGLDDEDYVFFRGSDLQADITDIVRQTIILAVGMKPLCVEDCRGLCPICGVNLNEQSCSCNTKKTDPRWEDLKKFVKE
jgi:uncharacterized protein